METRNDTVCKKCGAHATGDIAYCPHCGELLSADNISIVNKKDYDSLKDEKLRVEWQLSYLKQNAHTLIKGRVLGHEEYSELKKKADGYDNIFMYGIFGFIALCFLVAIVFGCITMFEDEPKTGLEIVKNEMTGKFGIYNHDKGFLVTPYEFDSIQHRNSEDDEHNLIDYYWLHNNWKFGVADSAGQVAIPCEIESVEGSYNGLFIMRENGYEGLFSIKGTLLFKPNNCHVLWDNKPVRDYYTPETYVGNIIPVKRNPDSGWELFDRTGRKISNKIYSEVIQTGVPNLIKVKCNGYYGLVDLKGEEIVECKAKWISRFQEDIAFISYKDSQYIYAIDTSANKVFSISKDYKTQWLFAEGLFARMDNKGKIGYYDKTGKLLIPHKYEQAKDGQKLVNPSFQGEFARVSYHGHNCKLFKDDTIKTDSK